MPILEDNIKTGPTKVRCKVRVKVTTLVKYYERDEKSEWRMKSSKTLPRVN